MGSFVIRHIEMTLDPSSIENAIMEIESLSDRLREALDALCKKLLEEGVMIAKIQLGTYLAKGKMDMRTGNLRRSIRVEMANGETGDGYLVAGYPGDSNSDLSYAVYFEFGFGGGSYYKKNDGSLIKSTASFERHSEIGNIARASGRTKNHPTDRDVYRRIEDYGTIQQKDGPEFVGWVYKDQRSGHFYVSHGQNPKPFMYDTLQLLTDKAESEGPRFIAEYIA